MPDLQEPVDLVDPDTQGLPEFSPWFLAKWELVLSAEQLSKFNSLYAARKFDVDNGVFQAWLLMKKASLPQAEREALQQVQTVWLTPQLTLTTLVLPHCTVGEQKCQLTTRTSMMSRCDAGHIYEIFNNF